MIKINKSKLPQEIVIKSEKDYRSEKVIAILQKDFHNKCYICEEKNPTTINVEHFLSYKNYEHLKYNWENLFYACGHCNKTKGSEYDNIIDCTKENPEDYIVMEFKSYPEHYVEVLDKMYSAKNDNTRELLGKVYNGNGSRAFISKCEAKNLKRKIADEMAKFTECMKNYCEETDSKLQEVYWNDIKKMLSRESNFAGFKRSMVLQNEELKQCFGELLS